jgi:signal transduction histidine kinase
VRAQIEVASRADLPLAFSSGGGRHVIHAVTPGAEAAGLAPRDRILAIDGLATSEWLRARGLEGEPGTPLEVEARKPDGRTRSAQLKMLPPGTTDFPTDRWLPVALPAVGLIYLGIGLVVWRLKPDRRESWALHLFCSLTAALLFLTAPATGTVWALAGMTIPLVGPAAFHLFTIYPAEPPWVVRHSEIRSVVWGLGIGLACLGLATPWLPFGASWVEPTILFYSALLAPVCIGLILLERVSQRGRSGGGRVDVMLLGGSASFLPMLVLLVWHFFWGAPFPWVVGLLGFFFFPAAIGYGILRRELFDVRMVAQSSAAYGAVTLGITGLFALSITFADAMVRRFNVDARSPAFSVAFLFLAILLFNPLRERIQRWVDGFFDRDRAAYRTAVRAISEAMVSMLSAREIVDRILVAVTDTMGVERAMVLLLDEDGDGLHAEAARGDWDGDADGFVLDADHPICRRLWMERRELLRLDFDDEDDPEIRELCRDVFDTLDVELLVPVLFGTDLLGVIAVSRQMLGERMGLDERQLLRTLANQSAIAIENARAFDEIAQLNKTLEARVEERTRELRDTQAQLVQSEKMRSLGQLVAGVAHELNNPIGFVHANLQLLEEYVERLMDPGLEPARRERTRAAISKLLASSREGTQRVKQIVQDLRTFSRTGRGDLQPISLEDEIDRTLALMEPRLKGGVEVEKDYGELPEVRCYVGQLNQVFMNLLMNACDAMDGRGRIRVSAQPEGEGVCLEFEDDGPGMPEEVSQRIFEPFFTTKPVGQGTGLGLSLSHGIIERHGGTMSVESEPGHGTRFTIHLPLEPPGQEGGESEVAA